MHKRYVIAGAATALALSFGACGDDEGGNLASNDEAVIVKADFIQAANAACEQRGEQMTARAQQVFKQYSNQPDSPKARRALIEKAIAPGFEGEIDDLRALEPPPGEEEEVEEVITTLEEMVARTRKDLAEGRNYPYRKTENVSAAYGLPACGHP
ncbi:MAG TPA: hypothetical protein VGB06_08750 [Solirubrobacterales bacterium]|jgi:hypothetical protein